MPSENWKPISPEELAEFKRGEPVVVRLEQWRKNRKEISFKPGVFESYVPSRGIVKVVFSFDSLWDINFVDGEFCDNTVGRYDIIEHYELHGDNSGYDE